MVEINGYDIALTRGDSLYVRVDLSGRDLPEGTDAVFTVKKSIHSDEVLIRKRFDASDEVLSILLTPAQTSLEPGAYVWDVRLQIPLETGGYEVYTPMEYASFVVLAAVGEDIGMDGDPGLNPDLPVLQVVIGQAMEAVNAANAAAQAASAAAEAASSAGAAALVKALSIGENGNWFIGTTDTGVAAAGPKGDSVSYYEGRPAGLGEAAPGTANSAARGDHVHPMPGAEDVGAVPAVKLAADANAAAGLVFAYNGATLNTPYAAGLTLAQEGVIINSNEANGDSSQQTAHPSGADCHFIRAKSGGVWSEWKASDNAAALGGKAPEYYLSPRNLLDNSDFSNPVNQREQRNLASVGYLIDRWATEHSDNPNLSVGDGCVTVTNGHITQRIPDNLIDGNKVYTAAAMMTDGTILIASGKASDGFEKSGEIRFGFSYDMWRFYILKAGSYVWAALYEGEYTADTLPPYAPKGYAAELAECQRYYFPDVGMNCSGLITADGEVRTLIPMNGRMRITPTIIVNNYDNAVGNSSGKGLIIALTSVRIDVEARTGIIVRFGTPLVAGEHNGLPVTTFATSLTFDADL